MVLMLSVKCLRKTSNKSSWNCLIAILFKSDFIHIQKLTSFTKIKISRAIFHVQAYNFENSELYFSNFHLLFLEERSRNRVCWKMKSRKRKKIISELEAIALEHFCNDIFVVFLVEVFQEFRIIFFFFVFFFRFNFRFIVWVLQRRFLVINFNIKFR